MINKLKSLTKIQIIALVVIIFGVIFMISKAMGMVEIYQEGKFAFENNFAEGDVSPDLLRPWMTIRFISTSYAVPQAYIFDQANIQPRKETTLISLERLNQQMQLGEINNEPVLVNTMREIILSYRANPIATGLIEQEVQDWMTIQYVANSTGISADAILEYVEIPPEGNAYFPIGYLSEIANYEGGKSALIKKIQEIVDEQGVKSVIP
jgi:hypothetical protein